MNDRPGRIARTRGEAKTRNAYAASLFGPGPPAASDRPGPARRRPRPTHRTHPTAGSRAGGSGGGGAETRLPPPSERFPHRAAPSYDDGTPGPCRRGSEEPTMAIGSQVLYTAEEFGRRPDAGYPEELVRGRIVRMPPPGSRHGKVCCNTAYQVRRYLEDDDLGHVLTNDSGVITERGPDTVRGANVCFYSDERVPKGPLPPGYLDMRPAWSSKSSRPRTAGGRCWAKWPSISMRASASSLCSTPSGANPTSSKMTSRPVS